MLTIDIILHMSACNHDP